MESGVSVVLEEAAVDEIASLEVVADSTEFVAVGTEPDWRASRYLAACRWAP